MPPSAVLPSLLTSQAYVKKRVPAGHAQLYEARVSAILLVRTLAERPEHKLKY